MWMWTASLFCGYSSANDRVFGFWIDTLVTGWNSFLLPPFLPLVPLLLSLLVMVPRCFCSRLVETW
jgi:hypothetical protein